VHLCLPLALLAAVSEQNAGPRHAASQEVSAGQSSCRSSLCPAGNEHEEYKLAFGRHIYGPFVESCGAIKAYFEKMVRFMIFDSCSRTRNCFLLCRPEGTYSCKVERDWAFFWIDHTSYHSHHARVDAEPAFPAMMAVSRRGSLVRVNADGSSPDHDMEAAVQHAVTAPLPAGTKRPHEGTQVTTACLFCFHLLLYRNEDLALAGGWGACACCIQPGCTAPYGTGSRL